MKKIFVILAVSLAVLAASSCSLDNLDIPQKGVIPAEGFYTEANAESAITVVYNQVAAALARSINGIGGMTFAYSPHTIFWNHLSDDIWATGWWRGDNDFGCQLTEFRFDYTQQTVEVYYRNMYACIYAANLVIANYPQDHAKPEIQRYVAEARAWRAWCYMQLAIGWGTPPLVKELILPDVYPTNSEPGEVWAFVLAEFADAAKYIPSKPSLTNKDAAIRLTKEAVYSFLGKAQVFTGKYAEAVTNLKTNVIDKNLYDLVPGQDLPNLFHKEGKYREEKVFEFNVVANTSIANNDWNAIVPTQQNDYYGWNYGDRWNGGNTFIRTGWGGINPKGDFCWALIENDGLDSWRRKASFATYHEALYDFPHAHDGDMTLEQKRVDTKRGIKLTQKGGAYRVSDIVGNEGFFHLKRAARVRDNFSHANGTMDKNFIVMRYAEVLLLYAEACVKSGQNLAHALEMVNKIQVRAGSKTISSSLTMDVIKKEKRFELWMEECRFADLVRWGDAYDALKNAGGGEKGLIPSFHENGKPGTYDKEGLTYEWTGDHGTWDDNNWIVEWLATPLPGARGFVKGKHELMPFPKWARDRNPELKQNPNWE